MHFSTGFSMIQTCIITHIQGWGRYFISVLRYKVKKYSEKVTKYK